MKAEEGMIGRRKVHSPAVINLISTRVEPYLKRKVTEYSRIVEEQFGTAQKLIPSPFHEPKCEGIGAKIKQIEES